MTGGRATSQDVADLAGVSRSAVSLVLNGRAEGMISPAKQLAIREAARKLNYVPNSVALSLRTSRTSTIGVFADVVDTSPVVSDTLLGAGSSAVQEGYLLLILGLAATDGDEERAWQLLRTRQLDALLFVSAGLSVRPSSDVLRQLPSAMANCLDADDAVPAFVADEAASIDLLTTHLVEHGHTEIALIVAATEPLAAELRISAYDRALRDRGLPRREPVTAGPAIADGHAAGLALLRADHPPTAIIAAGDRSAMGVSLAAAQLGLSVPRDLSLVTVEEDRVMLDGMVPPLTAVRQPYVRIGALATQLVLDRVKATGEPPPIGRQTVVGELIVRSSVAAPGRR